MKEVEQTVLFSLERHLSGIPHALMEKPEKSGLG